jgi:hypothetical protein
MQREKLKAEPDEAGVELTDTAADLTEKVKCKQKG